MTVARRTHTVIDSPVGAITLVSAGGALCGLHLADQRHLPDPATYGDRSERGFDAVRDQLDAYFEGQLREFDVPVALAGTPFQLRVWAALRTVPYGETASYGEIAARIGQPTASRAVGLANGRNPVAIIVPCHRVIGASGDLTGYGGGLDRKRWLLAHESGAVRRRRPQSRAAAPSAGDGPATASSSSITEASSRASSGV